MTVEATGEEGGRKKGDNSRSVCKTQNVIESKRGSKNGEGSLRHKGGKREIIFIKKNMPIHINTIFNTTNAVIPL